MTNITVTVPDDVYRRARIKAAEQGTSVSALVAAYLTKLTTLDAEFERLIRLQNDVQQEITTFSAAGRVSRDEVHSRAIR